MQMESIRRSPFKVARIESDPRAFGRRIDDVRDSATALYNRRNILISGPRGIGKSSLGSQLQTVYEGDATLLSRCHIDTHLPRYVCAFYACDRTTTLAELCAAILYSVERKFVAAKSILTDRKRLTIELDLKIFKAKLETDIATRRPATVATELVTALADAMKAIKLLGLGGINILIDELDLLPDSVNFGHFLKIVHETLGRERLEDVTFIFAGQTGIYSRLTGEDPSVERLVRHTPISTLDPDEARFVLEHAADHAEQPFAIATNAGDMILAISAGYPYNIHLIGDAAFASMQAPEKMTQADVLRGLGELFRSDKREKYIARLRDLSDDERLAVVSMARYKSESIPMRIPLDWLGRNLLGKFSTDITLETVLERLGKGGHVVVNAHKQVCQFSEELFRIFTALLAIDHRELLAKRVEEENRSVGQAESRELEEQQRLIQEYGSLSLDDPRIKKAIEALSVAQYDAQWEREDHSELTRFK